MRDSGSPFDQSVPGDALDGSLRGADAAEADSPLPDACAALALCCSFVPGVYQGDCLASLEPMNWKSCPAALYGYVQEGFIDGGPCVGEGHGTPACATLNWCCSLGAVEDCAIADAGEEDACVHAYYAAVEDDDCEICTGTCM
jgi:hypothetical protein